MEQEVFVVLSSSQHETRTRDPDDRWDRGNTHTDWSIKGLAINGDEKRTRNNYELIPTVVLSSSNGDEKRTRNNYELIPTDVEVNINGAYFLVYAIYSTGDTFGSDDCGRFEPIALFTTLEKAKACQKACEDKDVKSFLHENGEKETIYRPWLGYFEYLNDLDIEVVRVINVM